MVKTMMINIMLIKIIIDLRFVDRFSSWYYSLFFQMS